MNIQISNESIEQLFTSARTHHAWLNKPVTDDQLRSIYELAKWGPTSVNSVPMRVLFIRTEEAKAKLYPTLSGSNVSQVKQAPVTAIIAYDSTFYEHLPELFPAFDAKSMFATDLELSEATGFRNSSLQGAYFIMAARALGLDVGPMSGFDNRRVDQVFFEDTTWRSNFLCNLGYGDASKLHPRGARLSFDQACLII